MKNEYTLLNLILAAACICCAVAAFAQDNQGGFKRGKGEFFKERRAEFQKFRESRFKGNESGKEKKLPLADLNLSQDQREQLKKLRKNKEQNRGLMKQAFEKRAKINEMIKDNKVPDNEILAAVNESADLHREAQIQKVKNILEIRKILTPEQLGKFLELKKNFRQNIRQGMERPHMLRSFSEATTPSGMLNNHQ